MIPLDSFFAVFLQVHHTSQRYNIQQRSNTATSWCDLITHLIQMHPKYPILCFFRVDNCIWGYYYNRVTYQYFGNTLYYSHTVHFRKTNFSVFQKLCVLYHVVIHPPYYLLRGVLGGV